ncbi:sensor histidine kinase [Acetobacterium bakii]|uniref:histidine kinase n=1 Tax=Acetobacterium bakii TaxID=52689 RepID=A0A0L6TYW5_9FIRM|nr:HAMP domain-containing sensor histidine kinase [Acetobacterium bakii]KNZ41277.1 histidine kinase [Acetobacterium bakii]
MKNKMIFLAAAICCIGYWSYLFLCFHNPVLTAVSVLVCLFLLWLLYLQMSRTERIVADFFEEINQNLDLLFNKSYESINNLNFLEETLMARINQKIVRIAEILAAERKKSAKEKMSLQSLISDISHQVKTPMTNLKMLHETIQHRDLPDAKRTELLKTMGSQLDKLDFLLTSMVKTSRLEAGLIQLKKEEKNLFNTLAAAVSGITVPADKKNIPIEVFCQDQCLLNHDPKWTAEALFNVMENAVKYSPQNSRIRVSVEKWEMYTKINISDQGRGIPEAHYGKIFQRFYREESSQAIEGIGIGLYLAREIIQKQNGYIMVQSVIGKGSTFSVFLPNAF